MAPCEVSCGSHVIIDHAEDIEIGDEKRPADFETAIHYAEYGRFQYILLGICGAIYASCAVSTTTLSFVLRAAECDFELKSVDKGKLSAMPLIGMIAGCTVWGSLADSHGRKIAIMLSLLIDFLAGFISSFAYTFNFFLICRFFNGFGIIGATSIIFSYLGEFISIKRRDKVLGRLEVFWNVGIIILPGVAWSLLNKTMLERFTDRGNFSPWRIFVFVCSLPSLLSLILLYFFPETPKFLLSKGKYAQAKLVFKRIYAFNTGRNTNRYPVSILEGELDVDDINNNSTKRRLSHRIIEGVSTLFSLARTLFSQPYIKYLGITSFADFGLMASYYTLIMWFPEIFDRFHTYQLKHPNETVSVCKVSQKYPSSFSLCEETVCDPSIDNRVFIETLVIGLSCIPSSVSLSYFMNKYGKKYLLVSSLILSGFTTLALNWVHSSIGTLVLSCIFEALTSILEAVLFCVVVDLFPTNLRAVALAITATSGRLGAIFGNMTLGMLIDLNCIVPIYLFGSLLIGSGLLCLNVPRNENYITLH